MSQGLVRADLHPNDVPAAPAVTIDPAARKTKRAYNALSASSVGLELGIAVIVGLLGGMYLDSKLGTQPWLMLLFLVFGLVAGFRNVLRAVERAERAGAAEDKEAGRG
jgi:ATP synthase protein I